MCVASVCWVQARVRYDIVRTRLPPWMCGRHTCVRVCHGSVSGRTGNHPSGDTCLHMNWPGVARGPRLQVSALAVPLASWWPQKLMSL